MFDSTKELLDRIRLGESTFLELEEVRFAGNGVSGPDPDALADEVAAFANSRGGVFVFGVEDHTRDVVGIPAERLDTVVDFIKEVCATSIDPPIEDLVLDRLRLPSGVGDDVAVVKVEIPRSLFVHRSPGGFLHRVADSKRPMSTEYLARVFQQRSQTRLIRFDEQILEGESIENLTPDLWERFRTPRSDDDGDTFLRKLGLARSAEEGTLRPTVAGVLMGSEDPRRWLPNAYVQAVAYRGDGIRAGSAEAPYQLDAADVCGPLDRQIVEACRFVAKNMTTAAFKTMGRADRPQYDMAAVFEAVANAVAHRDYSVYGSKSRLRLFENRLEIYSPGAIANSLSIDSLRYRQSARNEAVCSLLAKCPAPDEPWLVTDRTNIMDRRGEGVPVILDNSTRLSGKEPQYRLIDDAELHLTIYAATPERTGSA